MNKYEKAVKIYEDGGIISNIQGGKMKEIKNALIACLNDLEAINEGGQYGRTIDLILTALDQIKGEV